MADYTYGTTKHAVVLAYGLLFGLVDSKGQSVPLTELIEGTPEDAIARAEENGGVVPELKRYSEIMDKLYEDEELTKHIYDIALIILEKYKEDPNVREVTVNYGEAAASAVRTLEAIDICDNADTLGELFAAADSFLRHFNDTLIDIYASVLASQIALSGIDEERRVIIDKSRKNLDVQLEYLQNTRNTLDKLRVEADSTPDKEQRDIIETAVRNQIFTLEQYLEQTMNEAKILRDAAVDKVVQQGDILESKTPTPPADGSSLAGVN